MRNLRDVGIWPVLVDGWQLECCGDAFLLGDEVSWTLALVPADNVRLPDEELADFCIKERRDEAVDGELGSVVRCGSVVAWSPTPRVVDLEIVRGVLIEEHHGGVPEALGATRGLVRRIRVAAQPHKKVGARAWAPEGVPVFRDVDDAPTTFYEELTSAESEVRVIESRLLVNLDVSDADSGGPPTSSEADPRLPS